MMKKQATQRKYNFSDPELYLEASEKIRQAHKDIDRFAKYGYDLERLKGFYEQCERFKELPDDEELLGDQMLMTEKKYDAAEKLKANIRSLMTRVDMKYGNRSGRYRKFGANKLGDMTDAQLIFCGRRVVRVARAQMDFLADVGVNETVVSRIVEANKNFEAAVNRQLDRVSERDIAVEYRVEKGNKLYEELVVLCNIGKDIWREIDAQRYEIFCLYESNNEAKKARKQDHAVAIENSTEEADA